jgi:hypothetical protein
MASGLIRPARGSRGLGPEIKSELGGLIATPRQPAPGPSQVKALRPQVEYDRSAALVSHRGPRIPRLHYHSNDGAMVHSSTCVLGWTSGNDATGKRFKLRAWRQAGAVSD